MADIERSSRQLDMVIHEVAAELVRLANEMCPPRKKWKQAYLDVRYWSDGGSVLKMRIVPTKGRIIDPEDPTPPITRAVAQIGKMRTKRGPDKWYGIRLTVTPANDCHVEYNQDPDGAENLLLYDE